MRCATFAADASVKVLRNPTREICRGARLPRRWRGFLLLLRHPPVRGFQFDGKPRPHLFHLSSVLRLGPAQQPTLLLQLSLRLALLWR